MRQPQGGFAPSGDGVESDRLSSGDLVEITSKLLGLIHADLGGGIGLLVRSV